MKAVLALLALPLRRMPVGGALVLLGFVCGLFAMPLGGAPELVVICGFAGWFWHMMAGFTLQGLLRPETLLLPRFRSRLAAAAGIDLMLTVALPAALMAATGDPGHALLAASLLLLVLALGVASGAGLRAAMLFWLVFVAAGWMPHLTAALARAAVDAPLAPLAVALAALLLLRLGLRPLLVQRDAAVEESPMQAIADGRKPSMGADGTPRQRGPIGRQLNRLFDGSAQRTLSTCLARYRAHRDARTRLQLVRAVLLPHDNPQAVLIRLAWVAAIATVYFFATHAAQRWNAGYIGAYAVLIGIGRFAAVGQGMLRMRPNLADLYMTVAPATRREFQALLADALLWLVAVAVFNCVAYAGLIALLLHAHAPARLLLAAAITGVGAAFGALAVHLVGPESPTGRGIAQMLTIFGASGVYVLVYWLLGRFGMAAGGLGAALVAIPFGIGAWHAARRDFLGRAPRFDAPQG